MNNCKHNNLDPLCGTCLDVCIDCGETVGDPNVCRIGGCGNDTISSTGWCHDCFVRICGTPDQIARYNAENAWQTRSHVSRELNLIFEMARRLTRDERSTLLAMLDY